MNRYPTLTGCWKPVIPRQGSATEFELVETRSKLVWRLYLGQQQVVGDIWFLEIEGSYFGSTDEVPGMTPEAAKNWANTWVAK